MEQTKENKMGTAPITPLIWKMALPAILSMMVQALYNIVDSIFVAKISSQALSAISIAFPIQMLMVAIGVGTAIGINSLVARRLGEGRQEQADSAATHGLLLGFMNWIIIALIGIFFTNAFFRMTTDNASIISLGSTYTHIVTIFSFGVFIETCVEKTLQATGNMIYPMLSQLLGCVINIILDPILIFGLGPVPKLGIAGAAIATVFGQIVAMLFCLIILFTKNHDIHVTFRNFRFSWKTIGEIYEVGIPAIVMQAISSFLITLLNLILIQFSEAAVNVFGIYYKLQSFVFMPVFGLNQGVMPVLGYNYGAHNKKRLLSGFRTGVIGAAVIMFVGTILFHLIPGPLLSLFDADATTMKIGIPALKTISLCFVPAAFGIMFSTLFQACGMGIRSLILSLIRQLICILPSAWILSKISLGAVWYAFPIAEFVAFILGVVFFYYMNKKVIQKL